MHCLCLGQSGEGIMAFAVSRVVGDAHLACLAPQPSFLAAGGSQPSVLKEGDSELSLLRSEWARVIWLLQSLVWSAVPISLVSCLWAAPSPLFG